jgi:hypothetical protein
MVVLNEMELSQICAGEAITITAVMAVLAAAIVTVVVYRLFMSSKCSATIPGGWKFTWN